MHVDEIAELVARHAAPVPRYTSYPTAPHFAAQVGNSHYREWLAGLASDAELSVYVHIPFCHELCWYCGCNTKAVQRYDPVARYLTAVFKEIAEVAVRVPAGHRVSHVHWGGGSPNVLTAAHIRSLADRLRTHLRVRGGAEFAVEIDPRHVSRPQVDAFAAAGVTRISLGVQDFEPAVQRAINRIQTFETTRRAVAMFRDAGVPSVNIDLVYGLPHQSLETARRTIDRVVELRPDRIAAFGYAHLPSRLPHQRLIDDDALPRPLERFRLAELIGDRLVAAGFVRIGLDHFARPEDALARRPLARNFQGYTTDHATTLIGIGASAIGRIGDAYVQNATPVADYSRRIEAEGLAVARGLALDPEDRMRAYAIERLMCDMTFSADDVESRYGARSAKLRHEAAEMIAADAHRLIERTQDGFRVTERGRPFLRSICAGFDRYLRKGAARHAAGV